MAKKKASGTPAHAGYALFGGWHWGMSSPPEADWSVETYRNDVHADREMESVLEQMLFVGLQDGSRGTVETIRVIQDFLLRLVFRHKDKSISTADYYAAMSPDQHVALRLDDEIKSSLLPAIERGDLLAAVGYAFSVGYRLCQIEVLPHDDAAKVGKRSGEGAAKGQASKATKAVQRREATQQAVRERWMKNPKLSLSAIQQALAKLDGKPFGSQSLIEKNTVGMKPAT